jgi:hypothetical protein
MFCRTVRQTWFPFAGARPYVYRKPEAREPCTAEGNEMELARLTAAVGVVVIGDR